MIPLDPSSILLKLKNRKTYGLQKKLLPNHYSHLLSQISGKSSKETLLGLIKRLPVTISLGSTLFTLTVSGKIKTAHILVNFYQFNSF